MSDTSRRRFLGVAGAGAAAAGAAAVLPAAADAAQLRPGSASRSVVAYVEDVASSQVTLLVGEREVVVRDRDLVVRLLNAAGR